MNEIDENLEKSIQDYFVEHPVEVDLTGYATEEYVDNAIAAIPEPDLSKYALKTEIPSTSGLATTKYVDEKFNSIEVPDVDLSNYYTKKEVNDAIANIDIPDVDLSNYYTKAEIDALIPASGEEVSY